MKSFVLTAIIGWLLLTGFPLLVTGQGESVPEGLGLGDHGLILGFNSSTFTTAGSSFEDLKYIPGITLGFYQEIEINPRFTLESEFVFTTKGSRIHTVGELYLHQMITYLEVPLLVKWIINPQKEVRIFLAGGPFIDLKLIAFNEVGFPDEISQVDVGVELGAGVKFYKLSFKIIIKQGFLDMDKSETTDSYKNRTLSLVAGISF